MFLSAKKLNFNEGWQSQYWKITLHNEGIKSSSHYSLNIILDILIRLSIGIILCMHLANERWRYTVTPSLIGWAHTQNGHCIMIPHVLIWWPIKHMPFHQQELTHWGRVTHIYVSKIIIIGSDNGLAPTRRQAIIWTNCGILWIGPLGINLSDSLITINTFSFKKIH